VNLLYPNAKKTENVLISYIIYNDFKLLVSGENNNIFCY